MKNVGSEGYIEVEGGRIWYSVSGQDRPGIPLILLHGGPGAPHYYLESLLALSSDRPVILYDQLGCGKSDRPEDNALWSIGRFAGEIDEVRRVLGLEKVHILGQSWGTMLAVDYMLSRKPEGVMSLVLSSPCLSVALWGRDCRDLIAQMSRDEQEAIKRSEAEGDFSSEEYKKAITEFYRRHVCRLPSWPECIARTFDEMGVRVYEYMWGPSEFTITGTLKNYERAEALKEIKTPALFTCGRYDEASPASTEYYHKMLPGSEFIVFEGASHMHHIEDSGLYLKAVRDFIGRNGG
ncbi:MAG: proline iminopeptidase-family hydrolase [Candidatus Omnitrophica bacterium]|nr:proline iminopeptidase-family hydrolase [Candidatus Omnitrophota bacterium]MDD5042303.1 proline iminopeptidase-family hydrolase [Candidatus Omnitrophota bacterium]MDD5501339.1 proline iminopeptidase-family hydrolase [Candidatus Omnitrophota bacterium]